VDTKAELIARLASIDFWLLIFGVIVVIGVGGESVFGIRHWSNSRKLDAVRESENEAQRAEIALLNADAATAKQKQAEAELQLQSLRQQVAQRHIAPRALVAALRDQAKPTQVLIVYPKEDPEAFWLAMEIFNGLMEAKWNVAFPVPIKPDERLPIGPSATSVGGNYAGVTIVAKSMTIPPYDRNVPFDALFRALRDGFAAASITKSYTLHGNGDESL
jgi:hypothetical protein